MSDFNELYPKPRTGKECKKTDCDRHKNYVAWQCGTSSLGFCMECKHAHVSQYKRKVPNAKVSGAGTASAGLPGWQANGETE